MVVLVVLVVLGGPAGTPAGGDGLGRHLVLARTSAGALAGDHRSVLEQLSTPDSPRLTPLEGAGQALTADRAVPAQGLGHLDVGWCLGEEQLGPLSTTGQLGFVDHVRGGRVRVQDADTHLFTSS
jgi:hypothetical protein